MSRELEPENRDKRRQAQENLDELQRVLAQIKAQEPPETEPAPPSDSEPVSAPAENAAPSDGEPVSAREEDAAPSDGEPAGAQVEDTAPSDEEPVGARAEDAAPSDEEPAGAPAEDAAPSDEESAEQPDAQAEDEQRQREALLEEQSRRRHAAQPAATVHLNKKPARKPSAKASQKRAARRRRQLMRLGTVVVVLLVLVVGVVSAVRALRGDGQTPDAGSGAPTDAQTQQENLPASQQESAQYRAIKDDTSLPAYAREYPGLYAGAVDEPNEMSEEKVCYLTFDDGPSSNNTAKILDVLAEKGVKATFFLVTSEIEGNEALVQRIVDEGHTLGIHADNHVYGDLYPSVEGYLKDFAAAYDKIYELTGYRVQGFRFPGGSNNVVMERHGTYDAIVGEMTRRGFEYYDWNAYAHDAEEGDYTVEEMIRCAVSEVSASSRNDVFLLMHDAYGKDKTAQALSGIIDKLKEKGIEMLPVTNSTRPVHFEVNENTPPDMPEPESESDDGGDSSEAADEN